MLGTRLKTSVLLTPPRPERFSLVVASTLQRALLERYRVHAFTCIGVVLSDTSVTSAKM